MKFYETREFKMLEKQYLELIREKGFDDIEGRNRDGVLRGTPPNKNIDVYTEEYYYAARSLLHELPEGSEEYDVWELHSEGISIKDIVKRVGISQRKVEKITKSLSSLIKKGV